MKSQHGIDNRKQVVHIQSWAEYQRRLEARKRLGLDVKNPPTTFANIGQRHPDYGMSPAEHELEKHKRADTARRNTFNRRAR